MSKKAVKRTDDIEKSFNNLYADVATHINEARSQVIKTVNHQMVLAYWMIGKRIIEEEQKGKKRADYGEQILAHLSERLTKEFGKGFSLQTLRNIRQFYLAYSARIRSEPRSESHQLTFSPNLSWTHYKILMRESREEIRNFYEIEAIKNHWSTPELERQMSSLLYERLAKSKDKKGLMQLSKKGQIIQEPIDVLKDPVVLEFLNLPESHRLVESKLEDALITHLQDFLMELGTGFSFVARQKRITLDGDHFYPDLVFYNCKLHCYFIADLKIQKLTHQDIGQMQMYVNYFDQEVIEKGDNPTIGLVLCAEKNDTVVRYTLGKNTERIFASKYQFHLPTKEQLEEELKKEVKAVKSQLKEE